MKSDKKKKNTHTPFRAKILQSTEIRDINCTEEDIKKILSNLNERAIAGPGTRSAEFSKLGKSSMSILLKIPWRTSLNIGQIF